MPITVSIVLVLRSRGVCCVAHPHQRIDRPPKNPTQTAEAGAPATAMQELEAAEDAVVNGVEESSAAPELPVE